MSKEIKIGDRVRFGFFWFTVLEVKGDVATCVTKDGSTYDFYLEHLDTDKLILFSDSADISEIY